MLRWLSIFCFIFSACTNSGKQNSSKQEETIVETKDESGQKSDIVSYERMNDGLPIHQNKQYEKTERQAFGYICKSQSR